MRSTRQPAGWVKDKRPSGKVKAIGSAAAGTGGDDGGVPAGAGGWLEAAGAAAGGLAVAEAALAAGALSGADGDAAAVVVLPLPAEALGMQPVTASVRNTATAGKIIALLTEYMLLPFKRTP